MRIRYPVFRPVLLVASLWLIPVAATLAWQQKPASHTTYLPVHTPAQQARQAANQAQLNNQIRKNQVEQQLQQSRSNAIRQPVPGHAATASPQLDQADQSRRQTDDAQQRALINRYQNVTAPPVRTESTPTRKSPAPARSGG